jgi:hypothetical protein
MSETIIKRDIRMFIRTSGFEVSSKLICPIVRLLNMKYSHVDSKKVALLTSEIIEEIR